MSLVIFTLNLIRNYVPEKIRAVPRITIGKLIDWRWGIRTEGWYNLRQDHLSKMANPDGHRYVPTTYSMLKLILSYLPLNEDDVFFDLGCGKGRTLCYFARKVSIKKCIGVDIVPELTDIAKKNAGRLIGKTPIEIITDDVLNIDLSEGTVFFLYDPFGPETLMAILNKIYDSILTNPRLVRIICVNLPYKHIYDQCTWLKSEKILTYFYTPRIGIWGNV